MAEKLGQPFMPWQREVADVGCEIDPETGLPAYREVIVTVPRQSGKTTLFLSWQIDRCVSWGSPQRSAFTAQTGKDARDKWLDELFPMIRTSKMSPLVRQINEGMGNESIRWKTGSLIRLMSTSATSGHSKTLHQAVMDEIWHDVDDRREQGLRPAMVTVEDAQVLVCSTAGTQASTLYNRKVEVGRAAALANTGRGVAYFEYSAPDDWDPEDEDSYFGFMPALCPDPPCRCSGDGSWRHTITLDVVRAERDAMERSEYRRAYGNRSTGSKDAIIPPELWQRVCDAAVRPEGKLRFGLDVAEDRSSAAIVAYGAGVFELIDHRYGTGWAAERCNELTKRWGTTVGIDSRGPAAVLAEDLENCEPLQSRQVIQACGALYDAIVQGRVRFRSDQGFDDAIDGAVKKPVNDNWVWSRKASTADVTPLMGATVAYAETKQELQPFFGFA